MPRCSILVIGGRFPEGGARKALKTTDALRQEPTNLRADEPTNLRADEAFHLPLFSLSSAHRPPLSSSCPPALRCTFPQDLPDPYGPRPPPRRRAARPAPHRDGREPRHRRTHARRQARGVLHHWLNGHPLRRAGV